MLTLISPAKSQNFSKNAPTELSSQVLFADQITQLVNKLKRYTSDEFEHLMKISPKLAQGVFDMYINFDSQHYGKNNAKQALFAFTGDVYRGLDALTLSPVQINYTQEHLLMISGLYGLIRPLDLIQAYRLEMDTKLYIDDVLLYDFWRKILTQKLNDIIKLNNHQAIVNLASNQYIKAIDKKMIKQPWFEVDFKEFHNGKYQTIVLFAKRARGRMMRYMIDHNINDIDALKSFDYDGYVFNPEFSHDKSFCFTRVKL